MRHALPFVVALLACACTPSAPAPEAARTPASRTTPAAVEPPPAAVSAPPASPRVPAASSIPARFHGRWAADAAACASAGHESRLQVGADGVQFHESRGAVKSVREDGDTLVLVLVLMLTGEGNSWETTRRLTLSADGTTLDDPDNGLARVRCA